jgi:hypothetical protein
VSNRLSVVLLKLNGVSVVEILRARSFVRVCNVCSAIRVWTTSETLKTTPLHILVMVFGSGNKFRIKRYVDERWCAGVNLEIKKDGGQMKKFNSST